MIEIQVLTEPASVQAVAQEWLTLSAGTFASAFTQPGWYQACVDAYGLRDFTVVTARDAGLLVGVLPLVRNLRTQPNLYMTTVGTSMYADYQPFIVQPGREAEVVPRLLDAALQHFRFTGTFLFPHIPVSDPALDVMRDWLRNRNFPFQESVEKCPRLRTEGMTYEELEQTWPSKQRAEVRRRIRRLQELGEVSLWRPATLDEALATLPEFFAVHDAKWLAQGWPGRFQEAQHRKHFEQIVSNLFGSNLFFSTLRCGEKNISFHMGFLADGWIQCHRRTYRPEFHSYSPGTAHFAMLAQYTCDNAGKGVDMLLGSEGYKYRWSTETLQVVNIVFGRSALSPAYAWMAHLKPTARRKLGRWYMGMKAWRQNLGKRDQGDTERKPDDSQSE